MARMACLMHVVLCVWNLEEAVLRTGRVRKRERALGLAPVALEWRIGSRAWCIRSCMVGADEALLSL